MLYNTPILKVPNATESTKDAAQYMFYKGVKQYNLCGEFCVAFCMQDEAFTDNIDEFLSYWEAKSLSWWQTIFKNKLSRTTGIYDLKKMLDAYEAHIIMEWGSVMVRADFFDNVLETHQAIVGVKIDSGGYLVGSGIPHWVVLDSIELEDENHPIVTIYNPFSNLLERYSWRELMTSTGYYKQGLWVAR